jgi:hypothetical protein
MLTKRKLIGVKTESAQNVAATLTATDFIHAWDVEVAPAADIVEKEFVSGSLDRFAHSTGKKWYEISFKTEYKGSGSAGTPPPVGALIQACGFVETINAGVNVTYAPISTPPSGFLGPAKSCTIKVYEDGILHTLAGCVGNRRLIGEAGKPVIAEWKFWGLYTAVTDAAFVSASPSAQQAAILQSATLQLQGYSATVGKIEIDLGNEVTLIEDINAANGVGGFAITRRNPSGSADPLAVTVATHDFFGKFIAGAEAQSSFKIGTAAGNTCTLTFPKTQYGRIQQGDKNGLLSFNTPLHFNRNSGDDWVSEVWT